MKAVIVLIVAFAILTTSVVQGSAVEQRFHRAKILVNPENSTLRISVNSNLNIYLRFDKIYYEINHFRRFGIYNGDLQGMKVQRWVNTSANMGKFVHLRMWKNVTLRFLNQKTGHYANVIFDLYIASRNYTKGNFNITRNMVRYDIHITSDLKSGRVFLVHKMYVHAHSKMRPFLRRGKEWRLINGRDRWYNTSSIGAVGFGESNRTIKLSYIWSGRGVSAIYGFHSNYAKIVLVFRNNGSIVRDPYVKLPVPLFLENETSKVVNYLFEHVYSLGLGMGVAMGIIAAPFIFRKLSHR